MKRINYYSFIFLFAMAGGFFTACSDMDLTASAVDESKYQSASSGQNGYLTDEDGKRGMTSVEFREAGQVDLFLKATRSAEAASTVKLAYDKSVLDAYNEQNSQSYEAFPETSVELGDGTIQLEAGKTQGETPFTVKFNSSVSLSSDQTYVIPLSVQTAEGSLKMGDTSYLIFVRDMKDVASAEKANGMKLFACLEVNDVNPLNALCFTLKNSGAYLFDYVILFSGNINYNEEEGRCYVNNNDNVTAILNGAEKYIRPLQEHGIKVLLGIMGNHDRSGVANLAPETAKAFAREVNAVCNTYGLDGIFWDDEWTKAIVPAPAGFVEESPEAAARLMYEVKKLQPERINATYAFGYTSGFVGADFIFDGWKQNDYLDYTFTNYGNGSGIRDTPGSNYDNFDYTHYGFYSISYAGDGTFFAGTEEHWKKVVAEGVKCHFVYNLNPFVYSGKHAFESAQLPSLQSVAKVLCEDELVYDQTPYRKDW